VPGGRAERGRLESIEPASAPSVSSLPSFAQWYSRSHSRYMLCAWALPRTRPAAAVVSDVTPANPPQPSIFPAMSEVKLLHRAHGASLQQSCKTRTVGRQTPQGGKTYFVHRMQYQRVCTSEMRGMADTSAMPCRAMPCHAAALMASRRQAELELLKLPQQVKPSCWTRWVSENARVSDLLCSRAEYFNFHFRDMD
jgi:hypothetical protein